MTYIRLLTVKYIESHISYHKFPITYFVDALHSRLYLKDSNFTSTFNLLKLQEIIKPRIKYYMLYSAVFSLSV